MYYFIELQGVVSASEVDKSESSSFDRPNLTDFQLIVVLGFTADINGIACVLRCVGNRNVVINTMSVGYFALGLNMLIWLSYD